MMVHKTLHESLQLAAWLKAHAKHMPMSPEENKMQRAALVMSDMYKQNKILRELLDLNRQEPHDAR
jgi:membrane peptidoglycan carboxypeptidase